MVTRQIINKINNHENFILKGGAGSGKTYTLIETLEELVHEQKKIAVITYTNVAKDEIIERLSKKNKSVEFCGTIHEFIWKRISNFQNELNVICKQKFNEELEISRKYEIIYNFGYHRVDNEELRIELSHDEVIEVFLDTINNYVDLYWIISNIYDCILVDEYQDTKQEVVDVLLSEKLTISCGFFGDPIQGIYANVELNMGTTEIINKIDNWRSSEILINFFNSVRYNINGDDFIQRSLNTEINNYQSKLLYYEVESFSKEKMINIEEENRIRIDYSLFLTHNLGLSNQLCVDRGYNDTFSNNQKKYSNNRAEIYTHLNFLFDLYEMKNKIMFEKQFVKKYFQVNIISKEKILEWELNIENIKNCTTIGDIKSLDFYQTLDDKVKRELETITDEMDIEYFDKMYEYSLEGSKERTMFSMKGLEADNILVYLNNGNWKHYNFKRLNEKTKKIIYVAFTRAKKNLIIVANTDIDNDLKEHISEHFEMKTLSSD